MLLHLRGCLIAAAADRAAPTWLFRWCQTSLLHPPASHARTGPKELLLRLVEDHYPLPPDPYAEDADAGEEQWGLRACACVCALTRDADTHKCTGCGLRARLLSGRASVAAAPRHQHAHARPHSLACYAPMQTPRTLMRSSTWPRCQKQPRATGWRAEKRRCAPPSPSPSATRSSQSRVREEGEAR